MFSADKIPQIYEEINKWFNDHNISQSNIMDIIAFTQTWGSTALGFGGWGGSTMTTALTTVFIVSEKVSELNYETYGYVFFNNGFAYKIKADEKMMESVNKRWMESCDKARSKYNF